MNHYDNGDRIGDTYQHEVMGVDRYGNTEPDRYVIVTSTAKACAIRTNLPPFQGCAEPPFDMWAMLFENYSQQQ